MSSIDRHKELPFGAAGWAPTILWQEDIDRGGPPASVDYGVGMLRIEIYAQLLYLPIVVGDWEVAAGGACVVYDLMMPRSSEIRWSPPPRG